MTGIILLPYFCDTVLLDCLLRSACFFLGKCEQQKDQYDVNRHKQESDVAIGVGQQGRTGKESDFQQAVPDIEDGKAGGTLVAKAAMVDDFVDHFIANGVGHRQN